VKFFTVLVALLALFVPSLATDYYVSSDTTPVFATISTPGLYRITSSGTFQWGDGPPARDADTEWMFFDNWEEAWYEYGFNLSNDLLDLKINDQFIDWEGKQADGSFLVHTFSPSHIYGITLYLDADVKLQIYDTDIHDNIGGLNVSVAPVPEPMTLGFVAFGLAAAIKRRRRS